MSNRVRYLLAFSMAVALVATIVVDGSGASPETNALVNRAWTLVCGALAAIIGAVFFIEWRDRSGRPMEGPEADYADRPPDTH